MSVNADHYKGPDQPNVNPMQSRGRARFEYVFSEQLQQYVRRFRMKIAAQTMPYTQRFGDVMLRVENQNNANEGELIIDTVIQDNEAFTFQVRPNYVKDSGSEELLRHTHSIKQSKQVVGVAGTTSDLTGDVVKSMVDFIDGVHFDKTNLEKVGDWVSRADKKKEGAINELLEFVSSLTKTTSVVAAGTDSDSLSTTLKSSEVRYADPARAIKDNLVVGAYHNLSTRTDEGALGELNEFANLVTKTRSVVANGASQDTLSTSLKRSEVRDVDQHSAIKENVTISGYQTLATRVNECAVSELMEFVQILTKTRSVVAFGTAPTTLTFNLIRSEVKDVDGHSAIKEDWQVTSWVALTTEAEDEEFHKPVTVTREVVAHTVTLSQVAGSQIVLSLVDELHKLKTTTTLTDYGSLSIEEDDEIEYAFPALLMGWTYSALFNEEQERTYFQLNPKVRNGDAKVVIARKVTTFSDTKGTPPTLFSFKEEDLIYEGMLFGVRLQNVLFDDGEIEAITNSDDLYWGFVTETFEYDATDVSTTEYLGLIGDEVAVRYSSIKWKYNLFKKTTWYITLE